jgi:signal transduction histidine kinase
MSTLLFVQRNRWIDAALVAGCLVLTAFAVKAHWSVPPRSVIAIAGGLGSVAQLGRRRWSPLATVAGAAAYVLSGNPGPLAVGLYSAGAYGKRMVIVPLTVVGWAGFAGWSWLDAGRLKLVDVATSALVAAVIAAVGVHSATRRALQDSLRDRAEQAEAQRALRDEQARAAERDRIAREMHDVLAHKVSLIAVHAGALELSASNDRERDGAALIRTTAREALSELRSVLRADPAPFADLTALIDEAVRAGQTVELIDRAGPLPPETGRTVFRVAQEALTNARKHAPGAAVTITLEAGEAVTVTVRNTAAVRDGLGLPGAGAGLIGLTERLRLAGGSLRSGPLDGGWQLVAVIPA